MTHFLDETGIIAHKMPKEARELTSFMALVVDETTKLLPNDYYQLISDALKRDAMEQQELKSIVKVKKFSGCAHIAKMKV